MPTYDDNEVSEHDSRETYFYEFVGTTTVRHTNAPIPTPAVIDGVTYTFTHPDGGIGHGTSVEDAPVRESSDGKRSAIEIKVSHKHPIVIRHKSFPPARRHYPDYLPAERNRRRRLSGLDGNC